MGSQEGRGSRAARFLTVPLIIILLASGCNILSEPDTRKAERARIEVKGSSPVPLLLITSTELGIHTDEETWEQTIVPIKADTLVTELPIEHSVSMAPNYQILYRVVNPDDDHEANIEMRVYLDEELVYEQAATLVDASLEFTYVNW